MANKRVMKRRIKKALVQELARSMLLTANIGDPPWDPENPLAKDVFDSVSRRPSYRSPTKAEIRRFQDVVSELHREAFPEFYK